LNVRSTSSLVVGLDDPMTRAIALRAYPNPTLGTLFLELPEAQGAATLQVFAADGREVLSQAVVFAGSPLGVSGFDGLAPGAYVLRVVHGDIQHRIHVVKE